MLPSFKTVQSGLYNRDTKTNPCSYERVILFLTTREHHSYKNWPPQGDQKSVIFSAMFSPRNRQRCVGVFHTRCWSHSVCVDVNKLGAGQGWVRSIDLSTSPRKASVEPLARVNTHPVLHNYHSSVSPCHHHQCGGRGGGYAMVPRIQDGAGKQLVYVSHVRRSAVTEHPAVVRDMLRL